MRAAFGLVGLLVTVGVLMLLMSKYMPVIMKSNQSATVQVNQIAGNDTETGLRASDSAVFQPLTTGGRLSGILVTRVVDAGAYQKYFGIQRNDTIIAAEYQGT